MIKRLISKFIFDYSLKRKLYIIIVFITIIPIIVLSMFQYNLSSEYVYNTKKVDMIASSRQLKILLDSFLFKMVTISNGIINNKKIQQQFLKHYEFPDEYIDRNHILKDEIAPWISNAFYWKTKALDQVTMDIDNIYITFYLSDPNDYQVSTQWDYVDIANLDTIHEEAWYKEITESEAQLFWRGSSMKKVGRETVNLISLNRPYKGISTLEQLGILSVECNIKSLTNLLNDVDKSESLYLYLVDTKGNIITQNAAASKYLQIYEYAFKNFSFEDGMITTFEQDSLEYMGISLPLSATNWKLIIIESNKDIQQQKNEQILLALFIGFLCLGASIVLMITFSRLITKRLGTLMDRMKNIKCYLGKRNVDIVGNDEIGLLDRQFVEMTGKVNDLISMRVKMERDNNRVKAELLQNQINPHLLYNSLSAIRCLADEKHDEDVSSITDKLIRFYRIALNNGNIIIPLADEITLTEEYTRLTKKVYDISMEFEFDIDPEALGSCCMKLILQPIVENSIMHGLRGRQGKGYLSIKVKKIEDNLHIRVFDNGRGIQREVIEGILNFDPNTNKGFGIYNVNRRIKL